MTEELRIRFKLISLFLQFPDESLMGFLDSMEQAAGSLADEGPRKIFGDLLSHFRRTPLLDLQQEYTRVFDLNESTTLNLTYHQLGNDKKRGDALAGLAAFYGFAGYETPSTELPDFLPMVLEFLSVAPEEACARVRDDFGECMTSLGAKLKEAGSIYAPLFDAL